MTLPPNFEWWVIMIVGLAGSAMCSGLETGSYSLNRVRLQVLRHEGWRSARTLDRLLHNPVTLLSTLLIGNNIMNYMGTAGLAVLLEDWGFSEWQTVLLNCLIVTPLLFVFGETLPKDLFSAHADKLMYRLAWFLDLSNRLFRYTGLTPLVNVFSSSIIWLVGSRSSNAAFHPRRMVNTLVKEGVGKGLLSDEQSAIVERVLELSSRSVADEMTPWKKTIRVKSSAGADRIWELADTTSHSRFPVMEGTKLVGMINVFDALTLGRESCPPAKELIHPVLKLHRDTPLRTALRQLQEERRAMAVVIDAAGNPLGVVTIKDLVEAITGELASW